MTIGAVNSFFDLATLGSKKVVSAVSKVQKDQDEEKIAQAAEDFEAFFVSKMMDIMYEGISTDGLFGGGNAEKIYRSLLIDEYGRLMAKSGGVGVKEDIMRSMLEMQEMSSKGYIGG